MKPRTAVNRILLALAGVVLLGGGLLVLAGGLDIYRRWNLTPPADWPLSAPHDVLLSRADRTRWTDESWWWPTVIAALALVVLLSLWWLLAQRHQRRPGRLPVGGTPPQDGVELRDQALNAALAADAGQLPGVHRAKARLTGRPTGPQARLTLLLTPDSAPTAVLDALRRGPLEHARESAGWEDLPAEVRLRVAGHGPHRVE
ncbi:alkaline shock response membrane anchor protein AmaP [Streptomyces sp. NBC_01537]|uniref:alkaline shock response membrane anchor protein AmaP n=1 Tax=Streptomyces sp. NBC_01537 TaxID=2903896 RepID=UPI00386FE244